MSYYITEPCVGVCDTACVNVCPVDCIYTAEEYDIESDEDKEKMREVNEMLYINPDECIDCAACEPECPVNAIYHEDEMPEGQESYVQKNKDRFDL
ncbi:ferredoxin family protein [Candidatus Uabimicrobium sp. HlEnr_7]|uniref:4Fe-4S dicluster domain-containing protein n=1 Tax=Candidatus Uabimicrobium helgolandensis TaxID=3095367 RepID=UPI0035567624